MPAAAESITAVALVVAVVAAEIALAALCVVDLLRRPAAAVTFGTKLPWYVIVVAVQVLGPIVYLAVGRREVPLQEDESPATAVEAGERAQRTVDLLYGTDEDERV